LIASRQFKIRGRSMKLTDQRSKVLLEVLGRSINLFELINAPYLIL